MIFVLFCKKGTFCQNNRKEIVFKMTTNNLTFIGIIPARYASTRFPGKPLAMLGGMTI